MRKKRSFSVFAKDTKFTTHEKRKLFIYVVMILFGSIFITSIREYLTPLIEKYEPATLLLVSGAGLLILYYVLDMKKY
jgi:hypothetical protein